MASSDQQKMFVTWDENDAAGKALAMQEFALGLDSARETLHAVGQDFTFEDSITDIRVRREYGQEDYERMRPDSAIPTKIKKIIHHSEKAYNEHGIFRNIVDLMSDFTIQGIDINHPDSKIEKFYKEWFKRVGGVERSERFVNYLFRLGNVVVSRQFAKLNKRIESEMKRSIASDIQIEKEQIYKRQIPWKYTFLNPANVEVLNEQEAIFLGRKFKFGIYVPKNFNDTTKESHILSRYFEDMQKNQRKLIPLDETRVSAYYYKKDDWKAWATPMVYPILTDLSLLKKMKLADEAALDGAISCIRVWKLGSIEHRILPTQAQMDRLASMLAKNVGGGVMDLVWSDGIELVETKTDIHKFLGAEKYAPCLSAIFSGLGIPASLVGGSSGGGSTGFTNNALSLKTIIERLEYARAILKSFWEHELKTVQKAMGFRYAPTIVFDRMSLSDEAAEKALLIQLADRHYISVEAIQEKFGLVPEIEKIRINREEKLREKGRMPNKLGPFDIGDKEHELKKAYIGTRTVSPSEVGLDLEENNGDKSPIQIEQEVNPTKTLPANKTGGQPQQGRPIGSKDSNQRKQRTPQPRTALGQEFINLMSWAEDAYERIGDFVIQPSLEKYKKKNMRFLTIEELDNIENLKFNILCNTKPYTEISKAHIGSVIKERLTIDDSMNVLLKKTVAEFVNQFGKQPTIEKARKLKSSVYTLWHLEGV